MSVVDDLKHVIGMRRISEISLQILLQAKDEKHLYGSR